MGKNHIASKHHPLFVPLLLPCLFIIKPSLDQMLYYSKGSVIQVAVRVKVLCGFASILATKAILISWPNSSSGDIISQGSPIPIRSDMRAPPHVSTSATVTSLGGHDHVFPALVPCLMMRMHSPAKVLSLQQWCELGGKPCPSLSWMGMFILPACAVKYLSH